MIWPQALDSLANSFLLSYTIYGVKFAEFNNEMAGLYHILKETIDKCIILNQWTMHI
jgi:hypothetical protein